MFEFFTNQVSTPVGSMKVPDAAPYVFPTNGFPDVSIVRPVLYLFPARNPETWDAFCLMFVSV